MDLKNLLQAGDNAWSQEAKLLFPGADAFHATTERWSIANPPTFAASLTAGNVEDVQLAVKLATSHDIPFMATSGKHGYCSRLAQLQDGLQVDLSSLDHVNVDTESSTMTVGPGALFKDIIDPLFNAGKEMTFGFCSAVSVIGATLGTGVGRYQALHGLVIDHLISARVVTASGDLVTASATENADLFWALRGAGVFFGVVVEATYRLHDLTHNGQCQDSTLVFPLAAAEPVLQALTSLDDRKALPNEVMITAAFAWEPRMDAAVFMVDLVYPGPSPPFLALIQPLIDLKPLATQTQTLPMNRLFSDGALGIDALFARKSQLNSVYGMCTKRIDVAALTSVAHSLMALYESDPATRPTSLSIEWYGSDVVRTVPADATAYAWRDTKAYFLLQAAWAAPSPSSDDNHDPTTAAASSPAKAAVNAWALSSRATLAQASGFDDSSSSSSDINADTDPSTTDPSTAPPPASSRQHRTFMSYAYGDESPEQIFGRDNLARLRKLKQVWDPRGVFRWGPAVF